MQDYFDTEMFIKKIGSFDCFHCMGDHFHIFDRLCKKIDVVKKIYKFYTADLSRKCSDEEIEESCYMHLMSYFILYSEETLDLKFINTSFKVNDILLRKGCINRRVWLENIEKLESFLGLSIVKILRN